jgi:(2Fe-2S) ferredoxin
LGVHPNLVELAFERAREGLERARESTKTTVVVVGRGSSDPDANGDFCKVVRLLAEGRALGWVTPCFAGVTRPRLEEALELVARARPARLVVVPYFLFGGRLMTKIREQVDSFQSRYPWIETELTPHLGIDDLVFRVMDERVADATGGARPLPCETCQYRVPVSAVAGNVGGLKALLWSLRHTFTHTQAMPHVHAHRPLTKHVLVCTNADCADRGSLPLLAALRRAVKDAGRERDIKVTRTLCMGRCGEGPTVAVYPDGIWYRGVKEADAKELVEEHLLNDRLVGRLVDNIMQ